MNKLLATAAMMAVATFVSQANATTPQEERWPRWYLGLSGGLSFLGDTDIKGGATGNVQYQDGAIGTVALGYMPPGGWQPFTNMRFEAELGYHYNNVDSLVLAGTPTPTSGRINAVSYMGNVYYDFRNTSRLTPYIGGGAGGAHLMLSKSAGIGNTDSSDNTFAYQFMAGIGYTPTSIPMTEWSLGYRYFVAQHPGFGAIKLDDYVAHNVEVGGKFRF